MALPVTVRYTVPPHTVVDIRARIFATLLEAALWYEPRAFDPSIRLEGLRMEAEPAAQALANAIATK